MGKAKDWPFDDVSPYNIMKALQAYANALRPFPYPYHTDRLMCERREQEAKERAARANACAAKKPDLPALFERHQQVDDFYAGLELFSFSGLLVKTRGMAMNWPTFLGFDRAEAVYWFPNNVEDPSLIPI